MLKWFTNLLDSNDREISRLKPKVDAVNAFESDMQALSDEELGDITDELKDQLANGQSLDDLLPEAFAAVREAARRTIGQRHYDVQLMGGMILHGGKIAEMKTGEGKTLVATLPAYLNALTGKGVHLVTVNDYLAKRDAQWMGPIYHMLGLSVASIQHDAAFMYDPDYKLEDPRYTHLRPVPRREAYLADITYGTNNEFGFDYLRDNMVVDLSQMVQRDLHYAIVDEVDNILIDEARTPLIISGQARTAMEQDYRRFAQFAKRLVHGQDYTVDEKQRSVAITEAGIERLETWLGIANLYEDENSRYTHFVENALKAEIIFKRDKEYIVKDGEIIIVDEFTGRQMPGRRWSDGLHQAIEAKEGVGIQHENLTLATITLQNYFRMFEKLAGMTGTANTEAEEFHKIYKLDVVMVPTHRAMIRKDLGDLVYKNEQAKFNAVVEEIAERHKTGQPVLVGTVSIETSEYLSELLRRKGVEHQVLNAKFHEREAEVVAQAGRLGAVTIATNMAGRGTDILLGGNPEGLALAEARKREIDLDESPDEYRAILEQMRKQCAEEREKVQAAGGLHIIGTERHESRRIDNQLRGRSGRQGDPGSSRFYVSLDDEIMRRFGGDRVKGFMEWAGVEDDVPIEHGLVSKSIETAQTKVEGYNFDIRKHVVEYDDVMNAQRSLIYAERRKILEGADLRSNVLEMVHDELDETLGIYLEGSHEDEWDLEGLLGALGEMLPLTADMTPDELSRMSRQEIIDRTHQYADLVYEAKERDLGMEQSRLIERLVMLQHIDSLWVEHLTRIEDMRQGIGLRAYGQSDPLVAYKREAYDMYNELRKQIRHGIAMQIYKATLVRTPSPQDMRPAEPGAIPAENGQQPQAPAQQAAPRLPGAPQAPIAMRTNRDEAMTGGRAPARATTAKRVGRNDPCPCGSGKKYKRCHGAAA